MLRDVTLLSPDCVCACTMLSLAGNMLDRDMVFLIMRPRGLLHFLGPYDAIVVLLEPMAHITSCSRNDFLGRARITGGLTPRLAHTHSWGPQMGQTMT